MQWTFGKSGLRLVAQAVLCCMLIGCHAEEDGRENSQCDQHQAQCKPIRPHEVLAPLFGGETDDRIDNALFCLNRCVNPVDLREVKGPGMLRLNWDLMEAKLAEENQGAMVDFEELKDNERLGRLATLRAKLSQVQDGDEDSVEEDDSNEEGNGNNSGSNERGNGNNGSNGRGNGNNGNNGRRNGNNGWGDGSNGLGNNGGQGNNGKALGHRNRNRRQVPHDDECLQRELGLPLELSIEKCQASQSALRGLRLRRSTRGEDRAVRDEMKNVFVLKYREQVIDAFCPQSAEVINWCVAAAVGGDGLPTDYAAPEDIKQMYCDKHNQCNQLLVDDANGCKDERASDVVEMCKCFRDLYDKVQVSQCDGARRAFDRLPGQCNDNFLSEVNALSIDDHSRCAPDTPPMTPEQLIELLQGKL